MGHVVLGIDPGSYVGLGLIRVDDTGTIVSKARKTVKWQDEFIEFINNFPVPDMHTFVVVLEEFRLRTDKAAEVARNKWSREMEASQVIGAVKFWAATGGHKLVMASPMDNPMNARHSGLAIPKNHRSSDEIIAWNHAHHYLLANKIIKHRLLSAPEE